VVDKKYLQDIVRVALAEDIGSGDITTRYTVDPGSRAKAVITAKEKMVVCGLPVCREVFRQVDRRIQFKERVKEAAPVLSKTVIATLSGDAASIIEAERVALNFLMHLSGIASATAFLVKTASRFGVGILDTRKTLAGLRRLQKYAVHIGGGMNHRQGLWDGILIKENHLLVLRSTPEKKINHGVLQKRVEKIKKATKKRLKLK